MGFFPQYLTSAILEGLFAEILPDSGSELMGWYINWSNIKKQF